MNKTLFDMPIAHRNDPQTSYEAGQKMIESGKLSKQEQQVLNIIQRHKKQFSEYYEYNFTAKELVNHTYLLNYYQIQRRLSGLYRKGKIERTGEKRNGCAVWKLKNG